MVNPLKVKGSEWYIFGRSKCVLLEDLKEHELYVKVQILHATQMSKYQKHEITMVYVRSLYPRFWRK